MSALGLSLVGIPRHYAQPEGQDIVVFRPRPQPGTQREPSYHHDRQFHRRSCPLLRMPCAQENIKPDFRHCLAEAVGDGADALHQFVRRARCADHLVLHQEARAGIEPIGIADESSQRVFQRCRIRGSSNRVVGRLLVGERRRGDYQIHLAAEVMHAGAARNAGPFADLSGRCLGKASFYDAVYGGLYEALARRTAALFLGSFLRFLHRGSINASGT